MTKTAVLFIKINFITFIVIFFNACVKEVGPLPKIVKNAAVSLSYCDSLNVSYASHIKPIINANCATVGCHTPSTGYLPDFSNYAVLKSSIDNGSFKDRVIVSKNMPPSAPLPDSTINKLNCWLNKGAPNN